MEGGRERWWLRGSRASKGGDELRETKGDSGEQGGEQKRILAEIRNIQKYNADATAT